MKKLDSSSALVGAVISEDLPIGICTLDLDCRVTFWNKTLECWSKSASIDIVGKRLVDIYPSITANGCLERIQQVMGGAPPAVFSSAFHLGLMPFLMPDGTRRSLRIKVRSLFNEGTLLGVLMTAEDVTSAAQSLKVYKELREEALAGYKARSSFLANMSHEIRTPMNGIIGMCNLLLNETKDSKFRERLEIIRSCGNTLLDVVNDILDFSKLEAGKIDLESEPFNIHRAVRDILGLLQPKAEEKRLTLSYTPSSTMPHWYQGDVTRFKQILTNLVGNAIKFTVEGGVSISSKVILEEGDDIKLEFSVVDTGIGIPDGVKDKLFKSFSQVDASTTKRFGGTGLGLAICQGLCQQMKGNIAVESQSGRGSRFVFSVVLGRSSEKESGPEDSSAIAPLESRATSTLRILVAEDNRTNQLVTLGFLEKLGYTADVAANGLEVLAAVDRQQYDLILMDCHMPEMDGFEATQKVLSSTQLKKTPMIYALTASATEEDRKRCTECGMVGVIGKPVSIPALQGALRICESEVGDQSQGVADIKKYLVNLAGMEDIARETIFSFLANVDVLLSEIERAMLKEDLRGLEVAAHTLRGAVSNFHATKVVESSNMLERIGRGEVSMSSCEFVFSRLKAQVAELRPLLKQALRERRAA